MKKCKIAPASCVRSDGPCCKGCPEKGCQARCLNDPRRCGCLEDVPPPMRRGRRKYDWDGMRRLYAQGLSQVQIAERLGCGVTTVDNALRKMGVIGRG